MPPEPKPPSKRRRRNAVAGETLLPAEGRREPAPPLPPAMIWADWTREYWASIWASPMATRWSAEHDVHALVRLAKLQQNALVYGDDSRLAEIRQLEDRFGLSPRGRRLLGWEIDGPDDASSVATDDASPPGAHDASPTSPTTAQVIDIDPRRLRRATSG